MTEARLETNEARQGETGFGMRWVLVVSTLATVFAFGLLAGMMI